MAGPAAVPGVDPSRVSTPDELAACLDGLRRRRGLSYEGMEKAAAKLPSRSGGSRLGPLPKSTVGEIVTGKRLPTKGKLLTFLAVCEVAPADLAQWLAAWERASTADLARPVGGIRVRDARPRLLGVHAAISVREYPTTSRRSTCCGMLTPPSSVSGPGLRPRRRRAGSCCSSAGPRSGRPGARSRR